MQYIQNFCLSSLFVTSIFLGPKHEPLGLEWKDHEGNYQKEYRLEDARFLLRLSLIVSESAYYKQEIEKPKNIQKCIVSYQECPLPLIRSAIPESEWNNPAVVARLFYDPNNDVLLIIFVGTINGCMAALDLSYSQVEMAGISGYTPGMRAHRGVYLCYKSVREQIVKAVRERLTNNTKLVISGHSLGGALSQLCALDFSQHHPLHYSFASPMIFNKASFLAFSRLVKHSYRVANASDMVAISPLPVMPNGDAFFHTGCLVQFQKNLGSYSLNHTRAYIEEYEITP